MERPDGLVELLDRAGLGALRELTQVGARTWRVDAANGAACLRRLDPARFAAEVAFLTFAGHAAAAFVPALLAASPEHGLAVVEWVDGRPIVLEDLELGEPLERVLEFLAALEAQRDSPRARELGLAAGAEFSIAGHVQSAARRVRQVQELPEPAATFVAAEVLPRWARLRRRLVEAADVPVNEAGRFISPGDIGLHNAVLTPEGRVRYLEFDRAGWDDPARVIDEFFTAIVVQVPERFYEEWSKLFLARTPDPAAAYRRAELLRPVFQIQWICRMLEEGFELEDVRTSLARFARFFK
jgi:hypothetical protein